MWGSHRRDRGMAHRIAGSVAWQCIKVSTSPPDAAAAQYTRYSPAPQVGPDLIYDPALATVNSPCGETTCVSTLKKKM